MSDAVNSVQDRYARYVATGPRHAQRVGRGRRGRGGAANPDPALSQSESYNRGGIRGLAQGDSQRCWRRAGIALGEQAAAAVQADRCSRRHQRP